tara:strand:- start:3649 stop:3765 length:117 start_codon:yes stop_codon:yes gene_type:complete
MFHNLLPFLFFVLDNHDTTPSAEDDTSNNIIHACQMSA